ncbi:hypothetical protein DFR67_110229 [Williamsia limnetica]|uniref:Peptidase S1 family protein n=1 Tax=Williamsia limnetica TaxID=882452 RepID=A0A318RME6_WILLI|nr:serine protease [Williamsia limnetica]PYE15563.1 hypothetical protein DFR67_110229 [Williamsia limnetica]
MLRKLLALCAALVTAALLLSGAGTATAAPSKVALGGGSGILVLKGGNSASACTLTTIGYDNRGGLYGLTAAHCGEGGQRVVAEQQQNRGVIGRITFSNHKLDYAIIAFDQDKVAPTRTVGSVTIRGVQTTPPNFGTIACKEGRTTGGTCGVTWFSNGVEHISQICVTEGDSGSPVVVGDRLIGMVNAYYFVGCIGPETGTNIKPILADLPRRGVEGFRVY